MSGDLKFDNMMEKTEEVLSYIKQHNSTFKSIGYESSDQSTEDICNNKIVHANYVRTIYKLQWSSQLIDSSLSKKLNKFVADIKLRQSLFAEVEYMIRNRPKEETINCDLKLIIQNMIHVSTSPQRKFFKSNVLVMRESSPLATLGFVAQMLCAHNEVIIESAASTAVLCHIFTTLCNRAGLDNVKLAYVEMSLPGANEVTELRELQAGCAAIVTGNADIDSAVDAIIRAPNVYPWHVRRVLVQECVGKRFRQALGWRSGLGGAEAVVSKKYSVNGKVYLHECTTKPGDGVSPIEEYRTVKELLSLCKEKAPLAVSLWCSDVCEANEIAHGVSSTMVWVNGLLELSGPPVTSQAFYSTLDTTFATESVSAPKETPNSESWSKLSSFERRELIIRTLESNEMKLDVPELKDGSFATVDGGIVSIGVQRPASSVFCYEELSIENVLSALMAGSAVFYKSNTRSAICNALQAAGVPVYAATGDRHLLMPSTFSMYKTKVVWTTFGTTFAN